MNRASLLALALPLAAWACGSGQIRIARAFDTMWEDDQGKSISAVRERLADHSFPKGDNVAVGVTPEGLQGLPLDGGGMWKLKHALDARPIIAGRVVVGTGDGAVFALDARTGAKLWERQAGGQLRGAGDDGATTVVTLAPTTGRGGVLLAIGRDGEVQRQLELDVPAGSPAVAGNLAFIPWANQYVTVYDLSKGKEIARATFRHQTSHAMAVDGTLYFGEVGATRFDDKIGGASRDQASFVELPARELPGSPRWMRSGGLGLPPQSDAGDRIRLYARPADRGGKLACDSDRFYATYYHAVLGMQAATGELSWVHTLPEDIIAGAAYTSGVAVCDEKGTVRFFDAAAGIPSGELSMGTRLMSCVVQADTLTRKPAKGEVTPLVQQIADAIQTRETEMVMMQRFLIRELSGQPGDTATRKLIELAVDPRISPVLLPEVREALSSRRNGTAYMIQALEKRYDFLADVVTPQPVGPIAFALAAMDERKTASLILEHMLDPQTSADDVKHGALALVKLAGPDQIEELVAFAGLYRCDAADEDLVQALAAVARTLLRLEGDKGRLRVAAWANDPLTSSPVKEVLSGLMRSGTPAR